MFIIANLFIFIINLAIDMYSSLLLLRFLLQLVKADYYNPYIQLLITFTDPVIKLMRRAIPRNKWDLACIASIFILGLVRYLIYIVLLQISLTPLTVLLYILLDSIILTMKTYFWVILAHAVLSWFKPTVGVSKVILITTLLDKLVTPVLKPFRKKLQFNGIDFSPVAISIALMFVIAILSMFNLH